MYKLNLFPCISMYQSINVTGWLRIPFTVAIRITLISNAEMMMPAQMQRPEGVRGPDGLFCEFFVPQGTPSQPVNKCQFLMELCRGLF